MNSPIFDFSVIITCKEGRGDESACVRAWTEAQSYPRERFQVILVTDGSDPAFERIAAQLLQSQDRLVKSTATTLHALYAAGCEAATGTFLFFTELHCEPDRHCLQAMWNWLGDHPQADGACAAVRHLNLTPFAELEAATMDAQWEGEWSRPDHWRRVLIRGTALRRAAYVRAGGFDGGLLYFADVALAARLHRLGSQIGWASDAIITHRNDTTCATIRNQSRLYSVGMHAFALREGTEWEDYVSMPTEWREALGDSRRRAWGDLGLFVKSMSSAIARPWRFVHLWRAWRPTLGARLLTAILGRGWRGASLGVPVLVRRLLLALPKFLRIDRGAVFHGMWERMTMQELVRRASEASETPSALTLGEWELKDVAHTAWDGVHGVERERGSTYRWTLPVCRLRCNLPPQRDCEATIRLHDPASAQRLLAVYWNGQRLPLHDISLNGVHLHLHLPACPETSAQELVFLCKPHHPSRTGSSDRRALGLAIASIELRERDDDAKHFQRRVATSAHLNSDEWESAAEVAGSRER